MVPLLTFMAVALFVQVFVLLTLLIAFVGKKLSNS